MLFQTLISFSLAISTILAHPATRATTRNVVDDFTGTGTIKVIVGNNTATASPDNSIGCLDATGMLTIDDSDCATFSRLDSYPYTLSSDAGNCTFRDSSQPVNEDSAYGKGFYAWHCSDDMAVTVTDEFYTINGFNYPYLCSGDTSCFYDAAAVPDAGELSPVWRFFWGSQQMGITPGHVQLLFLWEQSDA